MQAKPLAYHITFGTYGARLHGDARETIDRAHNRPGTPFLGADEFRQNVEGAIMRHSEMRLTREQQQHVESLIPAICQRGGWTHHTAASGPDHVHVLVSANAPAASVSRLLKRWLGQSLSERWPLPDGARWWAKNGSEKWIWDERRFAATFAYIERQRATPCRQAATAEPIANETRNESPRDAAALISSPP